MTSDRPVVHMPEFTRKVARTAKIHHKDALKIVPVVLDLINAYLLEGRDVRIPGHAHVLVSARRNQQRYSFKDKKMLPASTGYRYRWVFPKAVKLARKEQLAAEERNKALKTRFE